METDSIALLLMAEDVDMLFEGDQLALSIISDDGIVEHGATFTDQGDGSGILTWQTGFIDAGVYYTTFQVQDSPGEVDWWTVRFIINNFNRTVHLEHPLPDTTLKEDSETIAVCQLNDYFSDPDGDSLTFRCVGPISNWHGKGNLVVSASDGKSNVYDFLQVMVTPVNDPPSAFDLVQPADSVYRYSYPHFQFSWQESADTVEDSVITYNLVLAFNEVEHWYRDIADTISYVDRLDFVVDPDQQTEVLWWV